MAFYHVSQSVFIPPIEGQGKDKEELNENDPQDNTVTKDGDNHDKGEAKGPDGLGSCPRLRGKGAEKILVY